MAGEDEAEPAAAGGEITALLAAARAGDEAAGAELFRAVYQDLKRLARRQLAGQRDGATLSTTALVHEAYLRLARPGALGQHDRVHFFAVAARAMRQIVIDAARRRTAEKRGGGALAVELDEGRVAGAGDRPEELVALDAALARLEQLDERLARVVEWRYFGGLTLEEIAAALERTDRTIKRDWRKARAFLYRELAAQGFAG
jgi:RNA polymerase sigma factor (TIGR02999 family)